MRKEQVLSRMREECLIAVIRAKNPEQGEKIVEAVIAGGIHFIEITMTMDEGNPVEFISAMAAKYRKDDRIVIGAGTVLDPETARAVILAGANYVVSPGLNLDTIKLCNRYRVPMLPGVMTPTEAITALEAGCDVIKLFPGNILGPAAISSFKGPLPQGEFMPSGGVDEELLNNIRSRIRNLRVDALTMNQESLAEGIFPYKWYNPFPKFKFSERPDTAAACILEGNIVILVDNSPAAMVLPSSVFDIIEEADDYYFPPVTGTYLRLSRMMTGVLCLLLTPTWLLGMMHADALPQWLAFTKLSDMTYVPLIFQLLILEFAIDGLRLAAINTPSMLTTPLSVIAGIVLGEYSVKSGWFNSETMLYMAFVTIANYSQSSFELGYALKFMRVIMLLFTAVFDVWGYIIGFVIAVCAIVFNKTIAGKSYIYPIIPFSWKELKKRFFRGRLPVIPESQNAKQ